MPSDQQIHHSNGSMGKSDILCPTSQISNIVKSAKDPELVCQVDDVCLVSVSAGSKNWLLVTYLRWRRVHEIKLQQVLDLSNNMPVWVRFVHCILRYGVGEHFVLIGHPCVQVVVKTMLLSEHDSANLLSTHDWLTCCLFSQHDPCIDLHLPGSQGWSKEHSCWLSGYISSAWSTLSQQHTKYHQLWNFIST